MKSEANSKERILAVAAKLFAEKGYDGVGVREICAKSGVNVSMVSYYFGGKEELYNALLDDLNARSAAFLAPYLDFNIDLYQLSKTEVVQLLEQVVDKVVDFIYTQVSQDLLTILLHEQQSPKISFIPDGFLFMRRVMARLFDKAIEDREICLKAVFALSNINAPRVMLHFALNGQQKFSSEDILFIKQHVRQYLHFLTKDVHD